MNDIDSVLHPTHGQGNRTNAMTFCDGIRNIKYLSEATHCSPQPYWHQLIAHQSDSCAILAPFRVTVPIYTEEEWNNNDSHSKAVNQRSR